MSTALFVVGLDPGTTTGYAVWDASDRSILTVGGGEFLDVLDRTLEDPPALVVVEDGRALPIYARFDGVRGRERDKVARSVGETDARAAVAVDLLRRAGLAVVTREPHGRKWDADDLRRRTGWTGRTSQHARDAARLVVGMTEGDVARHLRALAAAGGPGAPSAEGPSAPPA